MTSPCVSESLSVIVCNSPLINIFAVRRTLKYSFLQIFQIYFKYLSENQENPKISNLSKFLHTDGLSESLGVRLWLLPQKTLVFGVRRTICLQQFSRETKHYQNNINEKIRFFLQICVFLSKKSRKSENRSEKYMSTHPLVRSDEPSIRATRPLGTK